MIYSIESFLQVQKERIDSVLSSRMTNFFVEFYGFIKGALLVAKSKLIHWEKFLVFEIAVYSIKKYFLKHFAPNYE